MNVTPAPIIQFGRSWFVELKIDSTLRALKVTLQLQKTVDPLSGMTVNLTSVDQAWGEALELKAIAWSTPVDFLKSLALKWQPWINQEKAQLIQLKIETVDGLRGWRINPTGLFYIARVEIQISLENRKSNRKCLLTSREPAKAADIKDFLSLCSPETSPDQLLKLLQQSRHFLRIEVLDIFEQFIEFDFKN